jgi:HAD superfamily hydrolase (TIGR01509 family)
LNTYDAILFDFDGVLVDSEPVHFECWSEILGDFGLSLKWESWAAECIGVSDRQMLERMSKQVHPAIDVETLYATYPRKRDRFRQLMEQRMPFFDGARELFESLHEYRLALVTSSGRPEVEPVLRKAGLFEYFDATVCFGEVAKIKPAPDPYLKAAEMVGAKRPLVVEDSEAGVESGRAAGFDVLRIVSPSQVPDALRQMLGM